jgi:hypothetical protein
VSQATWDIEYAEMWWQKWAEKPSLFATDVAGHLPGNGRVMELGAGMGHAFSSACTFVQVVTSRTLIAPDKRRA